MSRRNKAQVAQKPAAPAPAPAAPTPSAPPVPAPTDPKPLTLKGRIARIDVDKTGKAPRFLIVIADGHGYEYFSTPLNSEASMRITTQQLKAAFPELMNEPNVFLHLLTRRNHFVGRNVEYSISIQLDKETKQPKINPKTQLPYTNVRIEASSAALSEADALQLLGVAGTISHESDGLDDDDDIAQR